MDSLQKITVIVAVSTLARLIVKDIIDIRKYINNKPKKKRKKKSAKTSRKSLKRQR